MSTRLKCLVPLVGIAASAGSGRAVRVDDTGKGEGGAGASLTVPTTVTTILT